ncbi:AAA family ATPase, partial [Hoeflea sp.]|uniref:ATP-dependent nuclease n=1 Tax=Hoeflea sp. TaxID=1940281 RepID=UPI0019AD163F
MRIHAIEVEGFRGIKSGKVTFGDFTVLIGPNNSGKTTIIESLALLFGRDRLVRSLTEHDFYGSCPEAADRIKIVATISEFSPNDPARHPEWFRAGRAVPKWINPTNGTLSAAKQTEDDFLVCQIAFCARFDHASLEVESIRYFLDDVEQGDPFADDANITQIPIALIKELGFFLVPASRTWDRMISFGSELFRRAVTYVGGKPAEAVLEERDRLRNPEAPLEADEKMKPLIDEVNKDIVSLFGRQTELKLRLTSTDSEGVLEAVIPHFSEGGQMPLPSRRHGSGLISLQTLILLMRFGALRTASGENFLMCIEEPELHIPPPQQRRLLHLMQKHASQTIVTTHSPTVAAVPGPHQLVLLANDAGCLTASRLLAAPLGTNATSPQRGLFLSDRDATVTAIMNPAVVIPEGKTDANWLRLLARVADISATEDSLVSFTHEIGTIPTKDARIAEVFDELHGVHPML